MSADSFEEETKYAEIYLEFSDLIGQTRSHLQRKPSLYWLYPYY